MSHPLYNPRGVPFSNQRPVVSNQYGVNAQLVLDMAGARLGPAAGMMSSMMPQQMGYQMAQHPNHVNLTKGSSALKPGFVVTKPVRSPSFPPSNAGTSKRLPTPSMMNDYFAASPRIFPHTCSLCKIDCVQIKDWIKHQNTSIHIESCRRLRKQFPDWNVKAVAVSRSRSPSPWRYHGRSGLRGHRPRSRSPQWYCRSRSRSPSPRHRSRTPPPRRSRSRSFTRLSPPRATRRQQRSSSSERLAKKLIDSLGLAVTHNTTMEAMVESLAPALLAELAKKKSGPSSSSTKRAGKKQTSPPTSGKTVHLKTGTFKNVKGKKGPAGASCFLRLKGVPFTTSHQELMNAVQPYGKVNSSTLFKKTEEVNGRNVPESLRLQSPNLGQVQKGNVANSAAVEDKDVTATVGDSKEDCKPAAAAELESAVQAGKPWPVRGPAPTAPDLDRKPPDFPPITQDILWALEAAVHECRIRSSLRRGEKGREEKGQLTGVPAAQKSQEQCPTEENPAETAPDDQVHIKQEPPKKPFSLPHVWIIGSSLIARLQANVGAFGLDQNLGLHCQITWDGREGRPWEHLMPLLRAKRAATDDDPLVMVIHLGRNSIGMYGNTSMTLLGCMKADIKEIMLLFPNTKLLFSGILPRWNWPCQTKPSGYGLERARRMLNGAMCGFMSDMGMGCIIHRNIGLNNLDTDGKSLNLEGTLLLLENICRTLALEL